MTEEEARELALVSEKAVNRILLFEPTEELTERYERLGATIRSVSLIQADELAEGKNVLDGSFDCMILGRILDKVAWPLEALCSLRESLLLEGTLTIRSEHFSAEELIEMFKLANFRDMCFDFFDKVAICRAQRLTTRDIMLHRQFSIETRRILLYLLRRIESGIEVTENGQILKKFCRQENIDMEKLTFFIEETMLDPQKVNDIVVENFGE